MALTWRTIRYGAAAVGVLFRATLSHWQVLGRLVRLRFHLPGRLAGLLRPNRAGGKCVAFGRTAGETLSDRFRLKPYRMFETRLPRMHSGLRCRLNYLEAVTARAASHVSCPDIENR
jgi:hypothetical protein